MHLSWIHGLFIIHDGRINDMYDQTWIYVSYGWSIQLILLLLFILSKWYFYWTIDNNRECYSKITKKWYFKFIDSIDGYDLLQFSRILL